MREYLESTLTAWANKVDDVANRVLQWTAEQPESALRQSIAAVIESSGWGGPRIALATEAVIDVALARRGELATLGQAGIRNAIEDRMGILMMSMSDSVDDAQRLVSNTIGSFSQDAADALTRRLAALENVDDIAIRNALRAELGAGVAISDDLVASIRQLIVRNSEETVTGVRIFQSEISIMTQDQVQAALRAGGYTGDFSWAYSIHDHHFYSIWLGGREAGPLLRVRGFEHITDLEPAIFDFMRRRFPAITERSSNLVRSLIADGEINQQQITEALFDFYKSRYPQLSDDALIRALAQGVQ